MQARSIGAVVFPDAEGRAAFERAQAAFRVGRLSVQAIRVRDAADTWEGCAYRYFSLDPDLRAEDEGAAWDDLLTAIGTAIRLT
jgi:hypothetical protein